MNTTRISDWLSLIANIAVVGRDIVDPEFAALVDELLVDAQPDEMYKRMATWAGDQPAEAGVE